VTNARIAEALRRESAKRQDAHRARAFLRAASNVEAYPESLSVMVDRGEFSRLLDVQGVGAKIGAYIVALVRGPEA